MTEPAPMFAKLPSVERVLASEPGSELVGAYSREAVADGVRRVIDGLRERMKNGAPVDEAALEVASICSAVTDLLDGASRGALRRVVNATGVVLHTNLGRAMLAAPALEAIRDVASAACNLEYDTEAGRRGDRDALVESHLCELTGAEAATVVNNNAAAVILVLNSLAEGREAIVSRGELIEIGGSFRIPDIMAKSGAIMREVGTTNRTHKADYERALGERTALLLKVHTSNYRIIGFSASVDLPELADLAAGLDDAYVVEDLGSGALVDLTRWGLPAEPVVADRVAAGADLVTFSGDKLLGGPQCGVIVGRRDLVERIRRNPLKRALRCGKTTLAALEATLRVYRFDPCPERVIPTLRYLTRPLEELRSLAEAAATMLSDALGEPFAITVEQSTAQTGSGSQPEVEIASLALSVSSPEHSPDAIAARFRSGDPSIIGRIEKDRFLLDLRTIDEPADLVPQSAGQARRPA